MKYDILKVFRNHLNQNFNKNTADRYYFAVNKLFKNLQFDNVKEIDSSFLETETAKIKTKNNFSAVKNGLQQFKKVFPELGIPSNDYFKSQSIKKRNWTTRPKNTLYLDEIRRKINGLRNDKHKYAFRLMLSSGLRVFEVSALKKSDIIIQNGKLSVVVRNGKGGSSGIVECMPDDYLVKNLPHYLENKAEDEQLFYATKTIQKKADDLGIECHDLRRIAAITHRNANIKEKGVYGANNDVRELLRHERFSTTKRYLFNKKLDIRPKREIEEE